MIIKYLCIKRMARYDIHAVRLIYSKELDGQSRWMSEIIYWNVHQVDSIPMYENRGRARRDVTARFRGYQRG